MKLGLSLGAQRRSEAPYPVPALRKRADGMLPCFASDLRKNIHALPQLGPNLIANGGFDINTAGWSATNSTLAVVGGQLEITTAGAALFPSATLDFATTPGAVYAVTATARRGTSPNDANFVVQRTVGGNWSSVASNSTTSNITQTVYFTAAEAFHRLVLFIGSSTATGTAFFDDVSVREVLAGIPQGLGASLVQNGEFNAATGWTLGASWSVSGGVANSALGTSYIEQQITTVAGRVYEVTGTSTFSSFCGAWDNAGQLSVLSNSGANRSGNFRFYFVAVDTTAFIAFGSNAGAAGTLDNVTVREVFTEVAPRGADLITNGAFGTNTAGWAPNATATIAAVSGQLEVTGSGGAFPRAEFVLTGLTVGAVYELVASARRGTSVSQAQVRFASTTVSGQAVATSSTTLVNGSQLIVATATTDGVHVIINSATGSGTIYADDISVRQVFPLLNTAPVSPMLRPATFDEIYDVQAPSSGAARPRIDERGQLVTDAGVNQPRWDHTNGVRQLLIEGGVSGGIRNQTAAGAVVGVIGSGGAVPTNWLFNGGVGLVREIIGTGVINGIPYVDVRVSGTTGDTFFTIEFETSTQTVAAQNQIWTGSFWAALQAGTTANITAINCGVTERDSAGTFLAQTAPNITLTAALQRFSATRTMASASTGRTNSYIGVGYSSGVTIGLTLRIGLPDLKPLSFLDSPTISSGSALFRAAENIRVRPIIEAMMARSASSMVVQGRLRNNGTFRRIVGGTAAGAAGIQSSSSINEIGAGSGSNTPSPFVGFTMGSGNVLTGFGVCYSQDANTRLISSNGAAAQSIPTPSIPWSDVFLGGGPSQIADGWYDAFIGYPNRFLPATVQAQAAQYS